MQSKFDVMIENLEEKLPEFLRPKDLIKTGLYKSRSDITWSMKRNQAPPWLKLSTHKVVFPRSALCQWLREKERNDSVGGFPNDKSSA
jgi:predicted DNA-binding transcriptional regulator AlpA